VSSIQERIAAIPLEALDRVEKVITHAGCPDGIASAMLLRRALPEVPIEFVYHGTPEHRQRPCAALFCDFSPPAENAQEWVDAGAIVLDHHATARSVVELFRDRGVYADEVSDPGYSGAMLALALMEWRGFYSLQSREFARLAGIRDTWQKDHRDFERACWQASALTFFPVGDLIQQPPYLSGDQIGVGRLIYERRRTKAVKLAYELEGYRDGPYEFLLFNDSLDKLTSDVGEAVRTVRPDYHFVAGFFYTDSGQLVFSLRSVADGCDVARIAKANGGGGHTRAAGFQAEEGFVDAPIEALRRALGRVS